MNANDFRSQKPNPLKKEDRKPIFRGCHNEVCFCTGKCKEIVGYIEPNEPKL